jgi:hypothetical protein
MVESAIRPHEAILREILRVVRIPQGGEDEPENSLAMAAHKLIERGTLFRLRAFRNRRRRNPHDLHPHI